MDVDNCGDCLPHPALTAPPPRSLRGITLTLWLALGVEASFAVLSIAAYALRLHVITSIETGAPLSQQTVVSSDHFVRIVAHGEPSDLIGGSVRPTWLVPAPLHPAG